MNRTSNRITEFTVGVVLSCLKKQSPVLHNTSTAIPTRFGADSAFPAPKSLPYQVWNNNIFPKSSLLPFSVQPSVVIKQLRKSYTVKPVLNNRKRWFEIWRLFDQKLFSVKYCYFLVKKTTCWRLLTKSVPCTILLFLFLRKKRS